MLSVFDMVWLEESGNLCGGFPAPELSHPGALRLVGGKNKIKVKLYFLICKTIKDE